MKAKTVAEIGEQQMHTNLCEDFLESCHLDAHHIRWDDGVEMNFG
jgi:hypothetical protein